MTEAVVVLAVITPAPGRLDEVRRVLLELVPKVHEEPGCERYALHERQDGALVMIERYASQQAFEAHGAGENLKALRSSLDGLLTGPFDVSVLTPLPAGDPEKGSL